MNSTALIPMLLLTASLFGCGTVTLATGQRPAPQSHYDEYFDGWVLGVLGRGRADLSGVCPRDQIAQIQFYFSGTDVLFSAVTALIYTPRTVAIVCGEGATHAAQ